MTAHQATVVTGCSGGCSIAITEFNMLATVLPELKPFQNIFFCIFISVCKQRPVNCTGLASQELLALLLTHMAVKHKVTLLVASLYFG